MRRGCIAIGEVRCGVCGRLLKYGEQYLLIDEDDTSIRLCLSCSQERGYVDYKTEKGEQTITFFPK